MELTDQQVIDLFTRLGRIEEKLESGPINCPLHAEHIRVLGLRVDDLEEQVGKVETVIGRKELLVAMFGAIGIGFSFMVKYLWARIVS